MKRSMFASFVTPRCGRGWLFYAWLGLSGLKCTGFLLLLRSVRLGPYFYLGMPVRSILRYQSVVFVTLLLWLGLGWSGAHSHFCFDGQELPISVHMDLVGAHVEHDADDQHRDADIDVAQLITAKLVKIELPLLLAALLLVALLCAAIAKGPFFYRAYQAHRRTGVRPPLRAPPVVPA
jgi:hypothetical protein